MAERIVELHRKYNRSTLIHCHSYGIADRLGKAIHDLGVRAMWVIPRKRGAEHRALEGGGGRLPDVGGM